MPRHADGPIVRDALRCVHQDVRWQGDANTETSSGRRSLVGCPAKTRRLQRACPSQSERGGSATMAACRRAVLPRSRGAICRLLSVKKSPFCTRSDSAFVRSLGGGRSPSTISRELRRNAATRSGGLEYRATAAQWHAAKRPKVAKLATNDKLRQYVQDRLAGVMAVSDGTRVPGPNVHWNGRRHGPRQDRRWATSWSPEQIANRLLVDFPQDESMRVFPRSHISSALRAGPRRAATRTGSVLADWAGATRSKGTHSTARQELCQLRSHDQRAPRRSRGPSGAGTLGRGPDRRTGQLRDRDPGGTHHSVYDAAALTSHG